jgi:hypothetical protein
MSDALTLEQAEDLAARTLAAIEEQECDAYALRGPFRSVTSHAMRRCAADRERVASDLAGLRECIAAADSAPGLWTTLHKHARRYSDNLRRTGALYGVA